MLVLLLFVGLVAGAAGASIANNKTATTHAKHPLIGPKGGPNQKWIDEHSSAMAALRETKAKIAAGYNATQVEVDMKKWRAIVGPKNNMTKSRGAEAHPDMKHVCVDGDMVFNPEQIEKLTASHKNAATARPKREATTDPTVLWTVGVPIPFEIDSSLTSISADIHAALNFWTENTCLTFQESSTANGRLHYYSGSGCWSYVGKQPNWTTQDVSIGDGCDQFGVICHETGHALGFVHSQCRYDRDSALYVYWSNIPSSLQYNFVEMTNQTETHYGMKYDYGSIMQYDPYAFAVDPNSYTMLSIDPNYQNMMGQRVQPSFSDVKQMNILYKCAKKCSNPPSCQNNGIVNSTTCSSCICPHYFGGPQCQNLKQGNAPVCNGKKITATTATQTFNASFGLGMTYQFSDNAVDCYWQITAPTGYVIQLWISSIDTTCMENCPWAGFEINYGNLDISGMMVCCSSIYSSSYSTIGNNIYIKGTSSYNNADMTINFRAIQGSG